MRNCREKIFKMCRSIYDGKHYDFLDYNHPNTPSHTFNHILEDKDTINKLYKTLKESDLYPIMRTPKGYIAKHNIHHAGGAWDVKVIEKNHILKGVIITVIIKGYVFVFKCGMFGANKSKLNGWKSFREFQKVCKEYGIDLDNYATEKGEEVKAEIQKPLIQNYKLYKKIENVNHLDINSAWPSGVCETYPEFTPVFKKLREKDKLLGDMALGFCQSSLCKYKYSILAREGINNCNLRIYDFIDKLSNQKFEIIGINTDGIWYKDRTNQNRLYTDENEGTGLGQWKTDHKHCTFMAYSNGQYWFREDGKFNARARGFYYYETIKPREEWEEEDFDIAVSSQVWFMWDDKEGFVINEKIFKTGA